MMCILWFKDVQIDFIKVNLLVIPSFLSHHFIGRVLKKQIRRFHLVGIPGKVAGNLLCIGKRCPRVIFHINLHRIFNGFVLNTGFLKTSISCIPCRGKIYLNRRFMDPGRKIGQFFCPVTNYSKFEILPACRKAAEFCPGHSCDQSARSGINNGFGHNGLSARSVCHYHPGRVSVFICQDIAYKT